MFVYRSGQLEEKVYKSIDRKLDNDLYRIKYGNTPIISNDCSFTELPFLTRQELVTTPVSKRTYISPEDVVFFGFSSGTTSGVPLVSVFGKIDNYHVEPAFGTGIIRPLIVYPPLNKNFGASFIQQCREAVHTVSPVFGDYEKLANSAVLAQMTDCDSVYATPTIALKLAPYLEQYYDVTKIRFLAVASELMTPYLWRQLRAAYPAAYISNLYASSEIGQFIMYTKPNNMAEYDDTFILMTDTVAAVELLEGELIVTYIANPAFPLIRYKTGDYFELCSDPSDSVPRLRMMGRDGVDVVKIGGFEMRSGDLDAWVATLPQTLSDYQLHIYEQNDGMYRICLECVPKTLAVDVESVQSIITALFLDTFKISGSTTVADMVTKGIFTGESQCVIVSKISTESLKRKVLILHRL